MSVYGLLFVWVEDTRVSPHSFVFVAGIFSGAKAVILSVNIKFADRRKYNGCFDDNTASGSVGILAQLIADYEAEELEKYVEMLK